MQGLTEAAGWKAEKGNMRAEAEDVGMCGGGKSSSVRAGGRGCRCEGQRQRRRAARGAEVAS